MAYIEDLFESFNTIDYDTSVEEEIEMLYEES